MVEELPDGGHVAAVAVSVENQIILYWQVYDLKKLDTISFYQILDLLRTGFRLLRYSGRMVPDGDDSGTVFRLDSVLGSHSGRLDSHGSIRTPTGGRKSGVSHRPWGKSRWHPDYEFPKAPS